MNDFCTMLAVLPWLVVLTVVQFQLGKWMFWSTADLRREFPEPFLRIKRSSEET